MGDSNKGCLSLQDKVIIVTGAASGIGKASSSLFAQMGAKVVMADIAEEKGRKVEEELRDQGRNAIFIRTDVSSPEDAQRCVEETITGLAKSMVFSAMRESIRMAR